METFNVKRRDIYTFDNFMDLKKPGFGGPSSAKPLKDSKGKFVNKERKLEKYQNKVERHPSFSNQVFNPTYKAMGGDLVHKQEDKKNPYDYKDPYDIGIATVPLKATNEGVCFTDFNEFLFKEDDHTYYVL